jgi:hypothetical protein
MAPPKENARKFIDTYYLNGKQINSPFRIPDGTKLITQQPDGTFRCMCGSHFSGKKRVNFSCHKKTQKHLLAIGELY